MQHKYNSNAIQYNTIQTHRNNVLHIRGRWKQLKDRPNTGEPSAVPLRRGIDMLTCFQDPDQWHMGSCMEFGFALSTELYPLI